MPATCGIKSCYSSGRIKKVFPLFVFLCGLFASSWSQDTLFNHKTVSNSFISDGQDHQILLKSSRSSKLFVVFYPHFTYKIVVCSNNKKTPIEFKLTDNNGNIYFSNINKSYIREWEFEFLSLMNAAIELRLADENTKEESIDVLIGYKSIKD